MVQRRERIKSAHAIALFQSLNQRQAEVEAFCLFRLSNRLLHLRQAGLPVVELDEGLAKRALKVVLCCLL